MFTRKHDNEFYIRSLNQEWNKEPKVKIGSLIIKLVLPIFCAIIPPLLTNYLSGMAASPAPTEDKQTFTCEEFVKKSFFDIDFVTCVLTCAPPISNYQVIPYPYVTVAKHGDMKCVPLDNFFSQEQYVSNANGKCELKSGKTIDEFAELLQKYLEDEEFEIRGGCILAIQYVDKNNEKGIHLYELRNGLLIELNGADMEEAAIVIGTACNSESRINTLDWMIDNGNFTLPDAFN